MAAHGFRTMPHRNISRGYENANGSLETGGVFWHLMLLYKKATKKHCCSTTHDRCTKPSSISPLGHLGSGSFDKIMPVKQVRGSHHVSSFLMYSFITVTQDTDQICGQPWQRTCWCSDMYKSIAQLFIRRWAALSWITGPLSWSLFTAIISAT